MISAIKARDNEAMSILGCDMNDLNDLRSENARVQELVVLETRQHTAHKQQTISGTARQ
jgi:hypothetical protein